MNSKSDSEIIADMRAEIARATEKIIRKYEKKYGISVKRITMPELHDSKRIEYPEQHLY